MRSREFKFSTSELLRGVSSMAWLTAANRAMVTFSRPAVASTLAEVGLMLDETKMLLTRLQASMLCGQMVAYAAHHRVCAACGVLQPLKERRTRRLQTLFGTIEVEALRFKLCSCRLFALMVEARSIYVSPGPEICAE